MKEKIHYIIKAAMVLSLAAYLGILYSSDSAKDVSMDEIASVMEADSAITALTKESRAELKRFYQIEEKSTEGFFFYKADSPMAVEEILIVKASNKKQAQTFQEAAQAHLASQKNIFGAYGTTQMGFLNEAAVGCRGNYVYYMCGADAAVWQQAFLSLI